MTETLPQEALANDALVERLFFAAIDTVEIASVHIGGRLGFYRALAEGGEATPAELAARTGTVERYVREWLEQQAVARFLSVDDPDAEAGERRYGLPADHRPVLVQEDNLNYLTPLAAIAIDVLGPLESVRSNGGRSCPGRRATDRTRLLAFLPTRCMNRSRA
jgi:hypothetical protein